MKKNKMLSLAAAMVLTSTAAMAFDTNATQIQTENDSGSTILAGYNNGVVAVNDLQKSTNQYGDALIFPAFQTDGEWSTHFNIRNASATTSTVAKVVLYSAEKSEEIFDFNIYLSPKDIFTFDLKSGIASTSDNSTPGAVSWQGRDYNATEEANFDNSAGLNFNTTPLKDKAGNLVTKGYVVVYAMAESDSSENYHLKHELMWKDYRNALDDCRGIAIDSAATDWRNGFRQAAATDNPNMFNGMMTNSPMMNNVTAPNVADSCNDDFKSPDANLVGMTRISHNTDNSRDLMLPATALENFTDDGQMLLWAEGEYASLADRDINATGDYDAAQVLADSTAFHTSNINVAFDQDADVETKIIITQPYKRTLVQLGQTGTSYTGIDLSAGLYDGVYGQFELLYTAYDQEEGSTGTPDAEDGEGIITSPYDSGTGTDPDLFTYPNEVQSIEIEAMLEGARELGFDARKGMADVSFTGNLSAIITQMNGSLDDTGLDAQTNWTYAPIVQPAN